MKVEPQRPVELPRVAPAAQHGSQRGSKLERETSEGVRQLGLTVFDGGLGLRRDPPLGREKRR